MKKLALVILLLVFGCNRIDNGRIIDKQFVPEHEEETPDIVIDDITIPGSSYTIPDKWYIVIENSDDGRVRRRTLEVTHKEYQKHNLNDWYEKGTK